MGRVKRSGERKEKTAYVFPLLRSPSSFPPFALAPALRVTISTLPNLPLTKNQRWGLQQCKHELGFAHPKYACTAG